MNQELLYYGDVVCPDWFNHVTKSNGVPDYLAINILSRIAHLFTPTQKTINGVEVECKRFESDLPQLKYADLAERFNCSKKSIQRALVNLENLGLIERIYRTVDMGTTKLYNVMYVSLNIMQLNKISSTTEGKIEKHLPCKHTKTTAEVEQTSAASETESVLSHTYTEEEKAYFTKLLNACGSAGITWPEDTNVLENSKLMDKTVHTNTYNNHKCVNNYNITITTYYQLMESPLRQYVTLEWLAQKVTRMIQKVRLAINWTDYTAYVTNRLQKYIDTTGIVDIYKYLDKLLNNDIYEKKIHKFAKKKRPEQKVRSA